jgi:uncharacterized iron-regulated membrane protein
MTHHRLRVWGAVHKWTSLVSTAFLLLLCVTGLPLIFHEEIDAAFAPAATHAEGPRASLDTMVAAAKRANPDRIVSGVYVDPEKPVVTAYLYPSWEKQLSNPSDYVEASFDAVTGAPHPKDANPAGGFMDLMLRLHVDMFAGLPGQLFLGLMGLLFLAAIVSGVVLYGPFTKKLEFGEVRRTRKPLIKWLDLHNLLGIVTVAWAVVVGFTGALNEVALPLYARYMATDVAAATAPWKGQPPVARDARLASLDGALATAQRALPDRVASFISYPGNPYGTPHHYFIYMQGKSVVGSRMNTPVLVDGLTGRLAATVPMPWYMQVIEVSRPFHFGDYGGLPLKILWALFDVATIVVLGSGLYLWVARRKPARRRAARATPALVPAE